MNKSHNTQDALHTNTPQQIGVIALHFSNPFTLFQSAFPLNSHWKIACNLMAFISVSAPVTVISIGFASSKYCSITPFTA